MKIAGINEIILKSVKKDRYEKYLEMMPDFKSEKNEKLLFIILTISASIILGLFAVNPTLTTIANLQKQLDDAKFFESKLQEKITNLSILDQKYQMIQNDLPIVYDAVPMNSQVATLTATLQTIAKTANVNFVNLQMLKVNLAKQNPANPGNSYFNYQLTVEGDYQNLITFLDKMINFQRILTINNVTIIKSISQAKVSIQLDLDGNAYFKN